MGAMAISCRQQVSPLWSQGESRWSRPNGKFDRTAFALKYRVADAGSCLLHFYSANQLHTGKLLIIKRTTYNARPATSLQRHQREPPLWSRSEHTRIESPQQTIEWKLHCITLYGRRFRYGSIMYLVSYAGTSWDNTYKFMWYG